MTLLDGFGVFGVLLILVAYGGATLGRLDPKQLPALSMNLAGAGLILLSMTEAFNLSAFLMEAAWAVLAAVGVFRVLLARKP
jgi:hypothetical protein